MFADYFVKMTIFSNYAKKLGLLLKKISMTSKLKNQFEKKCLDLTKICT